MTTIGSLPRPSGEWDVPLPAVEAQTVAQPLREAIARETALHDDYEVSALSESLFLVTHPDVPVSTDADCSPEWAAWLATRIAEAQKTRAARLATENQQPGGQS